MTKCRGRCAARKRANLFTAPGTDTYFFFLKALIAFRAATSAFILKGLSAGCFLSNPELCNSSVRIPPGAKEQMKEILREIQSGAFAKEFILENRSGNVQFRALRKRGESHPMEKIGAKVRNLIPWLKEERLVDRSKN